MFQVFVGDRMACVGHLVTEATIGREDDLGLDSSFGYSKWRAMIIKDNEGDWALCAAAWKGMKAGTSCKSLFPVKLKNCDLGLLTTYEWCQPSI